LQEARALVVPLALLAPSQQRALVQALL